mmetsp:Transcript_174855/g.560634  ORF Transcript_174855/g.560634 Transcript_174855/m.560634 type:complete len:225 (+) Transcript_174855:2399-3073(+)
MARRARSRHRLTASRARSCRAARDTSGERHKWRSCRRSSRCRPGKIRIRSRRSPAKELGTTAAHQRWRRCGRPMLRGSPSWRASSPDWASPSSRCWTLPRPPRRRGGRSSGESSSSRQSSRPCPRRWLRCWSPSNPSPRRRHGAPRRPLRPPPLAMAPSTPAASRPLKFRRRRRRIGCPWRCGPSSRRWSSASASCTRTPTATWWSSCSIQAAAWTTIRTGSSR